MFISSHFRRTITNLLIEYFFVKSEKEHQCRIDSSDDTKLCEAGFYESECGTRKCSRIPGQACIKDISLAKLYGQKCHQSLFCCAGICSGTLMTKNGVTHSYNGTICFEIGKRSQPVKIDYKSYYNRINYPIIEPLN